jgi:hypothetical protein
VTRDQLVKDAARDLLILAQICGLRTLSDLTAAVFLSMYHDCMPLYQIEVYLLQLGEAKWRS